IGRTARAGAEGVAISFCASEETRYLRQIEKLMKRRIEVEQSSRSPTSSADHRTEGAPRPKPRRKPRRQRARSAAR
ncbi:MAG: ATP-dependent helicase, partial [Planctomycetota bacterium]